VFLDESGFSLTPTVKRTWAPKGHTPVLSHWCKRDKLSAIGALAVSPRQQHLGLYLQLAADRAFTGLDVRDFLQTLLRHLRGAVVLLWDRGTIHTRREVTAYLAAHPRVSPYNFPPYAPARNPAAHIWNQADAALANGAPSHLAQLRGKLRRATRRLRRSHPLLWACINASELPWDR
jgi:hypothetical protein